jgi:general secretion pathway protein G
MNQTRTLKAGFNFLEVMIIIAIIALFLTLVGPRLMSLLGRGKKTATQSTLNTVSAAIKQYKIDVGQYPAKLDNLVRRPENVSGWEGPYAGSDTNPEVQKDAWNQDLRYEVMPRGSQPPYKLWSMGDPDKEDAPIHATA